MTTATAKRLSAISRNSRFEGAIYHDAAGEPLAATDGHVLVVLRPSVEEAAEALLGARSPDPSLPGARRLATMLREVDEATATGTPVAIGEPDEALRGSWIDGQRERCSALAERLAKAEAKLASAGRGGLGEARSAARKARAELRQAETRLRKLDDPAAHAVCCGEAAVDLRLARRALRALGVRTGALRGVGEYDPVLLACRTGVGLVMPFRRSAS